MKNKLKDYLQGKVTTIIDDKGNPIDVIKASDIPKIVVMLNNFVTELVPTDRYLKISIINIDEVERMCLNRINITRFEALGLLSYATELTSRSLSAQATTDESKIGKLDT